MSQAMSRLGGDGSSRTDRKTVGAIVFVVEHKLSKSGPDSELQRSTAVLSHGEEHIALKSPAARNRLLRALPAEVVSKWAARLEPVDLALGDVIYEPGIELAHVIFPTTAIVSLLYVMQDGASAEIAVVGNDGLVGIALFMGGDTTPSRAVVQSAGEAFRLPAEALKEEFSSNSAVLHLFLRYTQALITQMAQTAVCNRHHTVRQQLCRWLLLSLDRLPGPDLEMTQELIGNMLGVRRSGVTVEALSLQEAGIISYRRGRIKVLDRPRLEAACCECYSVVKRETDRLLPQIDT
jgi:CRP-like cAMP-binding protein